VESRDIPLLRITSTTTGKADTKKRVWLQGLQHAREWIATTTVQYIAYQLVLGYTANNNTAIKSLLDQLEIIIVPIANPDGYEFTWAENGDRLWRKNRALVNGTIHGVDMNRNWPDHWNHGGASSDPDSDVYMGPNPGSEPEVQALMAAYLATPNRIGAIDFHSYSQLIMRPYGWGYDATPDDPAFANVSTKMVDAIQAVNGTQYTAELDSGLYIASGGADDWWYGMGTPVGQPKVYAMTVELSPDPDDDNGFVLPPTSIVSVGEEMVRAVMVYLQHCLSNPLPVKASAT